MKYDEQFTMISQLIERDNNNITDLCRAFEVHRSCYHYWMKRSKTINVKKLNEMTMV